MKVDQRKKVSSFQSDFKKEFKVGIRVYKGAKLADSSAALRTLTPEGKSGGAIDFGGNTKVKSVEAIFKKEMGIKVQVEDKKGGLADNNATLASLRK
jgi:hypothetical protein